MLTPWHVPMTDVPHDQWFRTKVLPIVADEDGHVVAATSAVSLALATGKLDFFFLQLPFDHHGPVNELSQSNLYTLCCTGPFNWGVVQVRR